MTKTQLLRLTVVLAAVAFAVPVSAQTDQPPASAPATKPTTRHQLVMPQGFKLVTVNNRNVLCEPNDESWVTTALGKITPTTKPATLPATLLQRLTAQRDNIVRSLTTDLAMSDMNPVAKAYDKELTPAVKKLDELQVPIYYLVSTPDRIADLMRNGWQDPRFYYNRAADAVSFSNAGMLDTEKPMDDIVYPALYNTTDTPDKRIENLSIGIPANEAGMAQAIDLRTRVVVAGAIANMVNNIALEPLKLKDDQTWFGVGVAAMLSIKYTAMITDQPRAQLVQAAIYEHPQTPLKMTAIDLLHPSDLKTVRPEAIPAYFDTVRRKSTRAIEYMIEKGGGDGAIPKALAAVRDKKPADGAATVKVVQDATSVDLTPALVH